MVESYELFIFASFPNTVVFYKGILLTASEPWVNEMLAYAGADGCVVFGGHS